MRVPSPALDQLRDPQAALAWLYRIATTVSLDRLRRRRPPTVPFDEAGAEEARIGERMPSLLEGASNNRRCPPAYSAT